MYTKQEAAQLRQQFWTSFGQYMAPVPSAEGIKINWINYKTGIKDVQFTMEADNKTATISIIISGSDKRQAIFFSQFVQLKYLLENALQEEWKWNLHLPDENNKTISRIYTSLDSVNIFKKDDWPAIISFIKPRIIGLDKFWCDVKDGFEY